MSVPQKPGMRELMRAEKARRVAATSSGIAEKSAQPPPAKKRREADEGVREGGSEYADRATVTDDDTIACVGDCESSPLGLSNEGGESLDARTVSSISEVKTVGRHREAKPSFLSGVYDDDGTSNDSVAESGMSDQRSNEIDESNSKGSDADVKFRGGEEATDLDVETEWVGRIEREAGLKYVEEIEIEEPNPDLLLSNTMANEEKQKYGREGIDQNDATSCSTHHESNMDAKTSDADHQNSIRSVEEKGPKCLIQSEDSVLPYVEEFELYNPLETAYHSEMAQYQEMEKQRTEATKREMKRTVEDLQAGGEIPVGFFDDPDQDAIARGEKAPSKLKEEQMGKEFLAFETTIELESQKEEMIRHRMDAMRFAQEFESQHQQQSGLEFRLESVRASTDLILQKVRNERQLSDATMSSDEMKHESDTDYDEVNVGEMIDWRAKRSRHL